MATRAFLVRQILVELGSWQAGQDLPPEDFRLVDEALPLLLQAMAKAKIYTVDDVDTDVPDEAVTELAKYLAGELTQAFGLSGEELQAVQAKAALADQALRFQRTRNPTYVRMRAEYY